MLGPHRVIAAVIASALMASPALAQPAAEEPSPKQKRRAGQLVKRAIAKSRAKAHTEAIELYLQAYAIVPLPTLLSNIGTEHQQDGNATEALRYFCMYLGNDPEGPLVAYATAQARALQDQLGNRVAPDDVCQPREPEPTAPAAHADTAAQAPPDTATLDAPMAARRDPGLPFKIAGMVSGAAGVVTLGAGIYFGVQAKAISDDISGHTDPMVPWRDDIKAYEAEGQRYEDRQVAALVVGGALVLGGAALYLAGRARAAAAERLTVTPVATADGGGLVVAGQF